MQKNHVLFILVFIVPIVCFNILTGEREKTNHIQYNETFKFSLKQHTLG